MLEIIQTVPFRPCDRGRCIVNWEPITSPTIENLIKETKEVYPYNWGILDVRDTNNTRLIYGMYGCQDPSLNLVNPLLFQREVKEVKAREFFGRTDYHIIIKSEDS